MSARTATTASDSRRKDEYDTWIASEPGEMQSLRCFRGGSLGVGGSPVQSLENTMCDGPKLFAHVQLLSRECEMLTFSRTIILQRMFHDLEWYALVHFRLH